MSAAALSDDGVSEDASSIARRFAPPRLVASQDLPAPDALHLIWQTIRDAVRVIRLCAALAVALIWRRLKRWLELRILRSLHVAWSLGTIGWGAFLGLSVYQLFLR